MAAELGASKCVEILLEQGADIEAKLIDGAGAESPLMFAVGYGHVEIARRLLGAGARSRYELTPTNDAAARVRVASDFERIWNDAQRFWNDAQRGDLSALPVNWEDQKDEMLRSMMDVSFRTREVNALEQCHDLETLRLLVDEYGFDVNQDFGSCYWPLKTFAEAGDAAAVRFLLERGALPDLTSTGDTALHAAVGADSAECVRLLLEAGANPNQQNVDLCVPMYRVASHEVLDLLLSHGADPNIADQCGFKPSHWVEELSLKERLLKLEKEMAGKESRSAKPATRNRKQLPSS